MICGPLATKLDARVKFGENAVRDTRSPMSDGAVTPLGRREQNRQLNRERILAAARQAFAESGYEATHIRDIVRLSGLSPGTFYNYFGDKQTVFVELVSDLVREIRQRVAEARRSAKTLEQLVRDAFAAYVEVLTRDEQVLQMLCQSRAAFRSQVLADPGIAEVFTDVESDMARAIKVGILPEFPVAMMSAAMLGAGLEVCARCLEPGGPSREDVAAFLATLFLGGIERFGK